MSVFVCVHVHVCKQLLMVTLTYITIYANPNQIYSLATLLGTSAQLPCMQLSSHPIMWQQLNASNYEDTSQEL